MRERRWVLQLTEKSPLTAHDFSRSKLSGAATASISIAVEIVIVVEHVEQVPDRRHVLRDIGIGATHLGIGEIVAAAAGQRLQAPVALDELNDRGMVVITVDHLAAAGEGRDHKQRNAGAVAEEIERLNEPRIPVTAALVKRNHEGGLFKQFRWGLKLIYNVFDHGLEEIELRASRVSVDETVGFHVGDRRQLALIEIIEEIDRVLDVLLALLRVAHDRFRVGERVADVAVVDGDELVDEIGRAVRYPHGCIAAAAVIDPGNLLLIWSVADG